MPVRATIIIPDLENLFALPEFLTVPRRVFPQLALLLRTGRARNCASKNDEVFLIDSHQELWLP